MTPELIIQIAAVLVVVVIFGVAVYLLSPARKTEKAAKAGPIPDDEHENAEAVLRQLRRYAVTNEFRVVEPVQIGNDKISADLDALLVGWFGVLGVKCLGYGGTIYGQASDSEWVQEMNGQRRVFANPLKRAEQSARAVRQALFEAKIKNVPVETVVVFTGKKTQLALPRSCGHYTIEQFSTYLKSVHFEEDKKVEVEPVAAALSVK